MSKDSFQDPRHQDTSYQLADQLVRREIDIAQKNQKITDKQASFLKEATRGMIYKTPKQDLGHTTTHLYNSIQRDFLGMEDVMGLPQRSFAPVHYKNAVQEYSNSMEISYQEAEQHFQELDITPQFFTNQMKKGDFKKQDLTDSGVARFTSLLAEEAIIDPLAKLPYQIHTKEKDDDQSFIEQYKKPIALAAAAGIVGSGVVSVLGDFDHDGYSNLKEYHIGTNPFDPDVDNDGLIDGQDPDNDQMSSWFEKNIADLDPLTPNDRYVLLFTPYISHAEQRSDFFSENIFGPISSIEKDKKLDKQYSFFNHKMSIPKENIFDIREPNATYQNFEEACDKIANISDENDLLYVSLLGHGSPWGMTFNHEDHISYNQLGRELNEINSKAQYIQITSCHSGGALRPLKTTKIIYPNNSFINQTKLDPLCGPPHPSNFSKFIYKTETKPNPLVDSPNSPRVILTATNTEEKNFGYPFVDSLYSAVLSEHSKTRLNIFDTWYPLIPRRTSPDSNQNGLVSIQEALDSANRTRFHVDNPILKNFAITSHPQISDPHNISDNFYFGEYWVIS